MRGRSNARSLATCIDTANTTYNIGMALHATGKTSEARAKLEEAAAVRRLMLGPDHPLTCKAECSAV